MNSTFRLKSSIALLVLGVTMLSAPKQPAQSTSDALLVDQQAIASIAKVAISHTMKYSIV